MSGRKAEAENGLCDMNWRKAMNYISDIALENYYSRDYYGEGKDYFYSCGWNDSGEPIIDDLAEVEENE